MLNIRKAEEKDTGKIMDLLSQVNLIHHKGRPDLFNIGTKYTAEELKGLLKNPSYHIFVAVNEKDEVLGYCFSIEEQILHDNIRTPIRTLYIDDLCVDEKCRHQHIGHELLSFMKEYSKKEGYHNLTLNVWELDASAKAFYFHEGFNVQKTGMEIILDK